MNGFESKVLNFIRENEMFSQGETVVVGFSGGADSTALLTVLCELRSVLDIRICAIHINHGIRAEASNDAEFTENFCRDRGITFKLVKKDIPAMAKELKLTEEEAGRYVRYKEFESFAAHKGAVHIAVAHHQNDVAETLLMNLVRGSGLHGGASIKAVRDNIVRPLLCVDRHEIEDYLKNKGLSYCTDRTNFENEHTRNLIRNIVLTELENNVNIKAVRHLAQAAASFEKADEYIRSCAKKAFDRIVIQKDEKVLIDGNELLKEEEVIRENIILLCFEALVPSRKDISSVHVADVLGLLKSLDGTASIDLPYGLICRRSYDSLEILKKETKTDSSFKIRLNLSKNEETVIEIPGHGRAQIAVFPYDSQKILPHETYTKWFDYDKIQETVFRTRNKGDVISIEQGDRIGTKSLSKYMTDEKIPSAIRDRICIIANGSDVIWIVGYRMGAAYKITDKTKNILAINFIDGGITNG